MLHTSWPRLATAASNKTARFRSRFNAARDPSRQAKVKRHGIHQGETVNHAKPTTAGIDHYGKQSTFVSATVPWLELSRGSGRKKTFLELAEAKHGPKEDWHKLDDPVLRRELLGVMVDYINHCHYSANKFLRYAASTRKAAFSRHRHFAAWVKAVERDPTLFDSWDVAETPWYEGIEKKTPNKSAPSTAIVPGDAGASAQQAHRDIMGHQSDHALVPERHEGKAPYEAYPFLRQRAQERPDTLGDEAREYATSRGWTAEEGDSNAESRDVYDPAISWDPDAIEEAATTQQHAPLQTRVASTSPPVLEQHVPTAAATRRRDGTHPTLFPRKLKAYFDRNRLTFDADGAYFKVQRNASARGKMRLKMVHFDPARTSETEVVKIDWKTIRASRNGTPELRQRARERMMRLCRGEDPLSVPPLTVT